ncbi:MAG: cobalamin biosynthesis protein P47K [Peptococcaceae bacterium]|jgi:Ni2+-binding GTPase involved in maturation of urease and hydrogenase|nr:cobalamin biosynthesis protein P47K [Peptococcaceae bacterium]
MEQKVIIFCGAASAGKTGVISRLTNSIRQSGETAALCKIDCLKTGDASLYDKLGFPYTIALSEDVCPDHFLVSNLQELINWGAGLNARYLLIETAGLCHRCSPATKHTISVCVIDATASLSAPEKLGPMLLTADIVAITKIDLVSQAEREIIAYNIRQLNPGATVVCADCVSGYGIAILWREILVMPAYTADADDRLRHTMPAAVCSYCIGERRIGVKYQQGVVKKIFADGGGLC